MSEQELFIGGVACRYRDHFHIGFNVIICNVYGKPSRKENDL
jgi:hypothetical protein